MMTNEVDIMSKEIARLQSMGIPYKYVNISDGQPVVIVNPDVMDMIIAHRDHGVKIQGLFVCDDGKHWTASRLRRGVHEHRSDLTECLAFRWALGYPIGTTDRRSRYAGQTPYKRSKKPKKRAKH